MGFFAKGDRFLFDGVEHLVIRTAREPIRNARLVYTDTGHEFYVRRDSALEVELLSEGGAL
jgi:hypothetical protein